MTASVTIGEYLHLESVDPGPALLELGLSGAGVGPLVAVRITANCDWRLVAEAASGGAWRPLGAGILQAGGGAGEGVHGGPARSLVVVLQFEAVPGWTAPPDPPRLTLVPI